MAEQLQRLLQVGARSWVRLQVLRLAMPRPVLTGSFTVLSFPDPADTDVAYFSEVKGRTVSQEGETEIQAIRTEFDQISGVALPQQESADLISELLRHGDQTICRGRRGFTQANEA